MINFKKFFIIAGPCVIESYKHLHDTTAVIRQAVEKQGVQWVLKSSYDKANRTSIDSFRGVGIEKGISLLHTMKVRFGCPITTDFHSVEEIHHYGTTVDIIQIPAFLSRQTDILTAAAKTGVPVNVKKGQFVRSIPDIVRKLTDSGCTRPIITERGSMFGYDDVVVDFRRFRVQSDWIDVLDVTHTVTDWRDSFALAKAGIGAGVNGLFVEVGSTKCDEKRSVPVEEFGGFLDGLGLS